MRFQWVACLGVLALLLAGDALTSSGAQQGSEILRARDGEKALAPSLA